jgi:transposase
LLRQRVVQAVRGGQSQRAVAFQFKVSEMFVRYWNQRAGCQRIDRVDWTDHRTTRSTPHNRTKPNVERCVLKIRKYLKEKSILGE